MTRRLDMLCFEMENIEGKGFFWGDGEKEFCF